MVTRIVMILVAINEQHGAGEIAQRLAWRRSLHYCDLVQRLLEEEAGSSRHLHEKLRGNMAILFALITHAFQKRDRSQVWECLFHTPNTKTGLPTTCLDPMNISR